MFPEHTSAHGSQRWKMADRKFQTERDVVENTEIDPGLPIAILNVMIEYITTCALRNRDIPPTISSLEEEKEGKSKHNL
jgi:hypothetical protein